MKAVEESEEKFEKTRGINIAQKQEKLKKPDEPSQLQQWNLMQDKYSYNSQIHCWSDNDLLIKTKTIK